MRIFRARLKQNRYPVFFLVEDLGGGQPYFSDTRTHSVTSAVALAKSEKFLVSFVYTFVYAFWL